MAAHDRDFPLKPELYDALKPFADFALAMPSEWDDSVRIVAAQTELSPTAEGWRRHSTVAIMAEHCRKALELRRRAGFKDDAP